MSIYGNGYNDNDDLNLNESEREVMENVMLSEAADFYGEAFEAFLESDEMQAMIEAGRFSKKTVVRMSKVDDLAKRTSMASLDLARQSNTSDWKKYQKAMKIAKEAKAKMLKQFGAKGKKIAKKAQKEFMKMPKMKVDKKTLKSKDAKSGTR